MPAIPGIARIAESAALWPMPGMESCIAPIESRIAGIAMGFSVAGAWPAPREGVAGMPGMFGMPVIGVALEPFTGATLRFAGAALAAGDFFFADERGFVALFVLRSAGAVADALGFGVCDGMVMPGMPCMPCMLRRAVSCCACAADESSVRSASTMRVPRTTRIAPRSRGDMERVNMRDILEASN